MFKLKRIKPAVSLFCATIVLVSLTPQADVHAGVEGEAHHAHVSLSSYNTISSGDFEYIEHPDGTAEIIDYLGSSSQVTIPGFIDGRPVIIGEGAFAGENLQKAVFEDGVLGLEDYAFAHCHSLKTAIFYGDEPITNNAQSIFEDASSEFVVHVPVDKNGWFVNKYGQWQGYNVSFEDVMLTTMGTYINLIWPRTTDKVFMPVGESITFSVQSDADEVKYAVHNGAAVTMTKTAANSFQGTWTPQESDKYDPVAEGLGYNGFRQITFSAYSSGTLIGQQKVKYAVLKQSRSSYTNRFNSPSQSFRWNSPTDHPFLYGYSNVYNCLNYVNGQYDGGSGGNVPIHGTGELESDNYQWTQYPTRIQYETTSASGSSRSAHVVKVVEWFESGVNKGKPKTIESKETSDEVIRIPAYITRSDGSLDFDIYRSYQPVAVSSRHLWSSTPVSIGVSGHIRPCTVSGCSESSATEPHTLANISNATIHYQKCSAGCGYETTPMSHTFGPWTSAGSTMHTSTCTFTNCGYTQTGTHSLGSWTNYSSTQHRRICGSCDYAETANHTWGPLTYTGSSGHYKVCTGCGTSSDTTSHSLTSYNTATTHYQKCSCGYETTPLAHTYGSWTSTGSAEHKRTCTFTNCGYTQTGSHGLGSWSNYSSTQHRRTCGTCDYAETANHTWGPLTYTGSSGHYKVCTGCGTSSDTTAHSLTSYNTATTHYQKCSCGYETTPLAHTYGSWSSTGSAEHKRTCTFSGCGYAQTGSHSLGSWSNYSSTQHRRSCGTCGYAETANHTWGPLTYTGSSGHYKECTGCGARSETTSHSLTCYNTPTTHYQKCACGYETTALSHTYGSWTSTGSTSHKRTCTFSGCGYAQTSSHSWGPLTYTGSSGHYKVCSVCSTRSDTTAHSLTSYNSPTTHYQKCSAGCGYETTPLSHTYGSWTSTGSTSHKRTCTFSGCGYAQTGSHSIGSWSNYSSTQHRRTCSSCNYAETANHTWGPLTYTGSSGHYKICSGCGTSSGTTSHSLTCYNTATTHYQKCSSGCGYQTTALSHTYGSWASTGSTSHKRTCTFSGCGYAQTGSHSMGSWSNYATTYHRRTCGTCGYAQTGSHSGTWSNYSSTQHRRYCSTCAGYQYESHAWKYSGSQMQCSVCKRWK